MKNKTENRQQELVQQDAPLKNTDNAFVQVNEDGSPHIPLTKEKDEKVETDRMKDKDIKE